MQQGCPTKHRFRGDTFNDRDGMVPDILVMMWIMLRKAKHGCELRDRDGQHIGEVPQNTCRALSAEHFGKLNQNALRSDTFEQVLVPVDGRCRGSFDRHAIHGGEAKGSEHSQAIFLESPIWISHAADKVAGNVHLASYEVNNTCPGVVGQSVHGEVPALKIVLQAAGKAD